MCLGFGGKKIQGQFFQIAPLIPFLLKGPFWMLLHKQNSACTIIAHGGRSD